MLLFQDRVEIGDDGFADVIVWRVPSPLRGSLHVYKYRLAYVVKGACVLRYDNEAGKGDHRHVGEREEPYAFTSIEQLMRDFGRDVAGWRA